MGQDNKDLSGRTRRFTLFIVLVVVLATTFGFGVGVGVDRAILIPQSASGAGTDEPAGFKVFWEAWDLVKQNYVDPSAIVPQQMIYGAVEGMLASLGDVGHTRFLSPDQLKAEQQALSGQLEGIGAELVMQDGQPTILAPIAGSPAQHAGLRPGDVIVRVDGKDVAGLTIGEVVNLVRGPAGTTVKLTIIHAGETELTELSIVRAKIDVPNVTFASIPGTPYTDILVSQFADQSSDQLVKALENARAQGSKGIILDLRNDPGGYLDQAVSASSQFLTDGNVLVERDAKGNETTYPVRPGGVATDIPLVVLINEGTASSSEIMAGALQDHGRAKLVGQTTFGTGTVLQMYDLSDGSAVWLGTREWLTPNGRQIWHHGITPDDEVQIPAGVMPLMPSQLAGMSAAQLQSSQDTQFLRALDLLKQAAPGS